MLNLENLFCDEDNKNFLLSTVDKLKLYFDITCKNIIDLGNSDYQFEFNESNVIFKICNLNSDNEVFYFTFSNGKEFSDAWVQSQYLDELFKLYSEDKEFKSELQNSKFNNEDKEFKSELQNSKFSNEDEEELLPSWRTGVVSELSSKSVVPDNVSEVSIVALVYNDKIIAYRFKTDKGNFDVTREVALKYGISEYKMEKCVRLENHNGILMSKREVSRGRCIPEISNNEEDCKKLFDILFK